MGGILAKVTPPKESDMDEFITRLPEGQSLKKRTSPAATPVPERLPEMTFPQGFIK